MVLGCTRVCNCSLTRTPARNRTLAHPVSVRNQSVMGVPLHTFSPTPTAYPPHTPTPPSPAQPDSHPRVDCDQNAQITFSAPALPPSRRNPTLSELVDPVPSMRRRGRFARGAEGVPAYPCSPQTPVVVVAYYVPNEESKGSHN